MTLPAIVRLKNYRDYAVPREGSEIRVNWMNWKAPPNRVYVAVILGTEPVDGSDPIPLLAMLRALVIDGESVVPKLAEASK